MLTVREGDTHAVYWEILETGEQGEEVATVDLTGATAEIHLKPKTGAAITLAATVEQPENRIRHTLTGTLAAGVYKLEIEITKAGVIATAPTGVNDTLIVVAQIA